MRVGVVLRDDVTRAVSALERAGHTPLTARTAADALGTFGSAGAVDILVLDSRLPDGDGDELGLVLRSAGLVAPLLLVLPARSPARRLAAYRSGADDVLSTPYDVAELVVRVEVLGRRLPQPAPASAGLRLDPVRHAVRTATGDQLLTPTEFRVLAAISARPDEVVRRRTVVATAWPTHAAVAENTLDAIIRRIRVKLDRVGSPVRVETVRGVGFRLSMTRR